jgi:transposase
MTAGDTLRLFVGDDWAEDHHDVEVMDARGRRLAKVRLPEGVAGIARLHAMLGEQLGEDADEDDAGQVVVGIETDRGPWVAALIAAGYTVYAINPLQASRYRERHGVSGAKSDAGDAHVLADMVRTDSHQLRPVAGDTAQAAAVKVVTRTHKTLIWERTRCAQRLRHALRDYFPAALEAFEDLDAPDALELLARAPDPASAARLTTAQISAALKRARRRDIAGKAERIQAVLRAEHLGQPEVVTGAYAASVRALIAVLATLNEQVRTLQGQVEAYFGQHPDAEIITSQPGLGPILGARVLAESGDDPGRYASAKARKNYAGTSPITRASGKKKAVLARYVHNDRLVDALMTQAFCALQTSPGARAYYDHQRARGAGHNPALRQLANRLVGILHGCLKTRTLYDEATAWPQHTAARDKAAA